MHEILQYLTETKVCTVVVDEITKELSKAFDYEFNGATEPVLF